MDDALGIILGGGGGGTWADIGSVRWSWSQLYSRPSCGLTAS